MATLNAWGAGDLAGDVALVVTELAANAIVHARSAFTVILSVHDDVLRISVRDAVPLDGARAARRPAARPGGGGRAGQPVGGRVARERG